MCFKYPYSEVHSLGFLPLIYGIMLRLKYIAKPLLSQTNLGELGFSMSLKSACEVKGRAKVAIIVAGSSKQEHTVFICDS